MSLIPFFSTPSVVPGV